MKIYILFNLMDGPWGGGNQFFKALKKEFQANGKYAEKAKDADVILFNSHHSLDKAFKLKKRFPEKIFIHRVDGPISLYRGKDEVIDKIIFQFNNILADGTVFQSIWSKEQNKKLYDNKSRYETVLYNAPDGRIFNKQNKKAFNAQEKVKLIAVSWSSHVNKGFDVYKYLDENLDFSKYEMTFVGNSPFEFKNIKHLKPLPSKDVAVVLKDHDIYITASQKDPCSNSLIEALSSGLPAVVLQDGGHPELMQQAGLTFEGVLDVIKSINMVVNNYFDLQSKIPEFSIAKMAASYYQFAEKVYNDIKCKKYSPKRITFHSWLGFYKMKFSFLKWRAFSKMNKIFHGSNK